MGASYSETTQASWEGRPPRSPYSRYSILIFSRIYESHKHYVRGSRASTNVVVFEFIAHWGVFAFWFLGRSRDKRQRPDFDFWTGEILQIPALWRLCLVPIIHLPDYLYFYVLSCENSECIQVSILCNWKNMPNIKIQKTGAWVASIASIPARFWSWRWAVSEQAERCNALQLLSTSPCLMVWI